jgi:tryptophan synthase alpha chain
MSVIEERFRKLKARGKKAFIPYIMVGYPSLEVTKDVLILFEECGADVVELGVPFTDPLADGPIIQRASEMALLQGITLKKVIAFVKVVRQSIRVPLVLMTYYNPVFRYGEEAFVKDAKDAGVNGLIIPDLPPEEAGNLIRYARRESLDTIFLLAPTSNTERIKKVAKASRGFIYYVSVTGITGSRLLLDGSLEIFISGIRKFTDKPIAVGFGVSSPEEASSVSKVSDGVIVGSAIVKRLHESPDDLRGYLISLREAIT